MIGDGNGAPEHEIIDAEVVDVQEVKPPEPSFEAWKTLLHEASRGNGIFPQAFLAQGILLADGMVKQAAAEDLPVQSFLDSDPPREFVESQIAESRDKMHAIYGIKTTPVRVIPMPDRFARVWAADKDSACTILEGFGKVILEARGGDPDTLGDDTMILKEVQDDPLFRDLLSYAVKGLATKEVRKLAIPYKDRIVTFLEKYKDYKYPNIPEGYFEDQADLMHNLRTLLAISSNAIREEVAKQTEEHHPDQTALIAKLTDMDEDDLFGEPRVTDINPLRDPNPTLEPVE